MSVSQSVLHEGFYEKLVSGQISLGNSEFGPRFFLQSHRQTLQGSGRLSIADRLGLFSLASLKLESTEPCPHLSPLAAPGGELCILWEGPHAAPEGRCQPSMTLSLQSRYIRGANGHSA